MKIKNADLFNSISILSNLYNEELPIKTSYSLAKNIKKIEDKYVIIKENCDKLIKKYGELNENGNYFINKKNDNFEKFENEYRELMSIEEDVELEEIEIKDFGDIKISPQKLDKIMFMLK